MADDIDGNRRQRREGKSLRPHSRPEGGEHLIFRVHRERVAGLTVRILLEPIKDVDVVEIEEGDEFITGWLATDPWDETLLAVKK